MGEASREVSNPYYVLRGDPLEAVEATFEEWAESMEAFESRRVGSDQVNPEVWISTVLMSIDPMLKGPLFETMVFGGDSHGEKRRYRTYGEALEGHEKTVRREKASESAES